MLHIFLRFLITTFICLTFTSCTLIKPAPDALNSDIDVWLASNQYDEIDSALDDLNNNDPQFKEILKRKPSILKNKKSYIEKTSLNAKKHRQKNQWEKALAEYDSALENIADNKRLKTERLALLKSRDKKVTELRKELLINRANALISYNKIYKKLHQLIPQDYSAQFDISQYESDKVELAKHLEKCGIQARKSKKYVLARDCYSLSYQLQPAKFKLNLVNKIDGQLKHDANKQRHNELLSAYKSAYKNKAYNKARLHLSTLLAISPNHKVAKQRLKELDAEIGKLVALKISSGKDFYSKNRINKALKIWELAQQLEPDNEELSQLISRAEKVSKKIESLEHNQ